jgi:hypothetical protein
MRLFDQYHSHSADRCGKDLQESSHPISKDVDGGTCVVNVGEDIAGLTVATMFEEFRIPSSSNIGLVLFLHMISVPRSYWTGMQLIRMKINAMMFIKTNMVITTYCT